MKNLRKLLLILLVVFLSGCTVKYDLVINSDSSVNEKVIASENTTTLKKNTGMNREQAVQYMYELFGRDGLKTRITTIEENGNTKSTVTGYHDSIDEYTNNFLSDIFVTSGVKRNGSRVTLLFSQIKKIDPNEMNRLVYDEIDVSITLPFKVIEENSDTRNGNTYHWKIKKNQDLRQIKIVYDEEKIKNRVNIKLFDTSFDIRYEFIAIGIIGLVIIIITIVVLINNKKNNKV